LVLHYLNDILCKNYNYMFVFAKVIPKTLLVPFFSGHGVLLLPLQLLLLLNFVVFLFSRVIQVS